jgi:hypothetical protein
MSSPTSNPLHVLIDLPRPRLPSCRKVPVKVITLSSVAVAVLVLVGVARGSSPAEALGAAAGALAGPVLGSSVPGGELGPFGHR